MASGEDQAPAHRVLPPSGGYPPGYAHYYSPYYAQSAAAGYCNGYGYNHAAPCNDTPWRSTQPLQEDPYRETCYYPPRQYDTYPHHPAPTAHRRGTAAARECDNNASTTNQAAADGTKSRTWEESYDLVVEYYKEHGNANVPYVYKKDPKLGRWVEAQRKRKGSPSADKIAKLDALGFAWDGVKEQKEGKKWQEMFQCLQKYKQEKGDCNVPRIWPDNQKLAYWVGHQRAYYRDKLKRLTPERIQKLESIGFAWRLKPNVEGKYGDERKPPEQKWEEMFQCLIKHKKEKGDCYVPRIWPDNQKLANWVTTQRANYRDKRKCLTPERIAKLESIGFVWRLRVFGEKGPADNALAWKHRHQQLVEFNKKSDGESLGITEGIQNSYGAQRGDGVAGPRSMKDQGDFASSGSRWSQMFQSLKKYKQATGHCNVSIHDNTRLASWVQLQRQRYKGEKLSDIQMVRLESIGFGWSIGKGEESFSERQKGRWQEAASRTHQSDGGDAMAGRYTGYPTCVEAQPTSHSADDDQLLPPLTKEQLDGLRIGFSSP